MRWDEWEADMKPFMRSYEGSELATIASKIYTFLCLFLRPEDAEDLLQDVLLELWRRSCA